MSLLSRQIIFVTGKGGTGKSTITAALGELGASLGKRTLMVEIEAKGNLANFFEHEPVGFVPEEVRQNLWCMTMNTQDSLSEYLDLFLKIGRVSRVSLLSKIFDLVANAAPGVREILIIGKIAYEATLLESGARKWDLIVVDSAPTGRIIGQLEAPRAINELFEMGMVRDQTDWMIEILSDSARTALVAVTTPEEMPTIETIELYEAMGSVDVAMEAVVVNKVLPELFNAADEELFDELATPDMQEKLAAILGGPIEPVVDAARMAVQLRRSRVPFMQKLDSEIPLPMFNIPFLFGRDQGNRSTQLVAEGLRAELGL